MKQAKNLTDFTKSVIFYISKGYTNYKIVRIPPKKADKTAKILKKVSNTYKTNLTRSQRSYRRRHNISNYMSVSFNGVIVILRTAGKNNDKTNEFKNFGKEKMEVEISEWITLVFFVSETNRVTARLSRETYRRIKDDFYLAIKNKNKANYRLLKKMWLNLPWTAGIGKQGKMLNMFVKQKLKEFNLNWQPIYSLNA
jgi:hypothetical protein